MSTSLQIERALLSCIAPLTGERSTGSVLATAPDDPTVLPRNTYGVPVVASASGRAQLAWDRMVKTTEDAEVSLLGTSVPVVSVLGGVNQEVLPGATIRWMPAVPGVAATAIVEGAGITGSTTNNSIERVARAVIFEGLEQNVAQGLWAGKVGGFPAVVIAWEAASPQPRVGRGAQPMEHRFRLYVVSSRSDGDIERRDEGKAILRALQETFADRAAVDGYVFSTPPTKLGPAGRLALAPGSYVYWQELLVTSTVTKRDPRAPATFPDWLTTTETIPIDGTPRLDDEPIVDQEHDMDPET